MSNGFPAPPIVRLDLITECRRRLQFLNQMVKNAKERRKDEALAAGRRRRIA
jgi:hypothetical protein